MNAKYILDKKNVNTSLWITTLEIYSKNRSKTKSYFPHRYVGFIFLNIVSHRVVAFCYCCCFLLYMPLIRSILIWNHHKIILSLTIQSKYIPHIHQIFDEIRLNFDFFSFLKFCTLHWSINSSLRNQLVSMNLDLLTNTRLYSRFIFICKLNAVKVHKIKRNAVCVRVWVYTRVPS